jgi:VanZ like family/Concanavalin A-like lectin/glucanases superfamily
VNIARTKNGHATVTTALCLLVLACIFIAGLWPFHAPRNAVEWMQQESGLRFNRHGSVVSATAFRSTGSTHDTGHSLEIRLSPDRIRGGAILAFDSSPDPRSPFVLRQYGTSIAVQRYLVDPKGNVTQPWFRVDHIFKAGEPVFLTITSGQGHVELYKNGLLAGSYFGPGIESGELTGRLVLANSTIDDSWQGQMSGLAIYDYELTPAQVTRHYQAWTAGHGPDMNGERVPVALYAFNERSGNIVHNVIDSATNLTIPSHYFVLHPAFLRSTWNQYAATRRIWTHWGFWQDLAVNVFGFVPVGFVFFAYFSSVKPIKQAALAVILLGFSMSFAVEALQRLLPNRDSGMTDLFTNTAGTALGVLLYQSSAARELLMRFINLLVDVSPSCLQEKFEERPAPPQEQKLTLSA